MALPIIGDFVEGVLGSVGKILTPIIGDKKKRDEVEGEIRTILAGRFEGLEETYRRELDLQKEVMLAELKAGDGFTRRARPALVYVGLGIAAVGALIAKLVAAVATWRLLGGQITPEQAVSLVEAVKPLLEVDGVHASFWTVWGGVAGLWVVGRTRERVGADPGWIMKKIYRGE